MNTNENTTEFIRFVHHRLFQNPVSEECWILLARELISILIIHGEPRLVASVASAYVMNISTVEDVQLELSGKVVEVFDVSQSVREKFF